MNRAGVAEIFRKERQHRGEDFGVHGRRRVVIKIGAHSIDQNKQDTGCVKQGQGGAARGDVVI
jgi:hypothetical protein